MAENKKDVSPVEVKGEERKILGCKVDTFIGILNMGIGALMIFYSIFSLLDISFDDQMVIDYFFKVY